MAPDTYTGIDYGQGLGSSSIYIRLPSLIYSEPIVPLEARRARAEPHRIRVAADLAQAPATDPRSTGKALISPTWREWCRLPGPRLGNPTFTLPIRLE